MFQQAIVLCLAVVLAQAPAQPKPPPIFRRIPISIFIDQGSVVTQQQISRALEVLNEAWGANVGITLNPVEYKTLSYDAKHMPIMYNFTKNCRYNTSLLSLKSPSAELVFVFTPQKRSMMHEGEVENVPYCCLSNIGLTVFNDIDTLFNCPDLASKPLIINAMQQALGHLFGLEQTYDLESFMHQSLPDTYGEFTAHDEYVILENKWRRWPFISQTP